MEFSCRVSRHTRLLQRSLLSMENVQLILEMGPRAEENGVLKRRDQRPPSQTQCVWSNWSVPNEQLWYAHDRAQYHGHMHQGECRRKDRSHGPVPRATGVGRWKRILCPRLLCHTLGCEHEREPPAPMDSWYIAAGGGWTVPSGCNRMGAWMRTLSRSHMQSRP